MYKAVLRLVQLLLLLACLTEKENLAVAVSHPQLAAAAVSQPPAMPLQKVERP